MPGRAQREDDREGWGGFYASVPGNSTPMFPSGDPPSSPVTFSGCVRPARGAAGGEGSGRGAGGRVPTTPPLPRGAIFKSIFSCLIRLLLSQQTEHGSVHT